MDNLTAQQLDLVQEQLNQKEKLKKQPEPFTSAFFTDQSREAQVIQEAFSAGNYTFLRNLPDYLSHYAILDQTKERIEQSYHKQRQPRSQSLNQTKPSLVKLHGGGYFTAFQYTPIEYDHAKRAQMKDQKQHMQKQQEVSSEPFKPVKNINKMKWEDPFHFTNDKAEYIYPFHVSGDYYDIFRESQLRQKHIEDARILCGSFVPPGKKHPYGKSDLLDIIKILNDIISSDWPNAKVLMGVTNTDTIEVIFILSSLTCQLGLLTAYMNSLINDERVAHYSISRVIEKWAVKNDAEGTLLFTIKPPWIRLKVNQLHDYKVYKEPK